MTKVELKHYTQMWWALSRITRYQTVARLRRSSAEDWGLDDSNEAIEYAYESVLDEAKRGLKGARKPERLPPSLKEQS